MKQRKTKDYFYVMIRVKKWMDWAIFDTFEKADKFRQTLEGRTHIKKKRGVMA